MSKKKTALKKVKYSVFLRVFKLINPYKGYFTLAVFLAIILAILTPLRPYLIQQTIDEYILKNNNTGLQLMVLLLFILLFVDFVLQVLFGYLTNWLGQSIIKNLRLKVFDHIIHFKLSYFDTTPVGINTTRTISDVEAVNNIFSEGLVTIPSDMLQIFIIIGIMFYTDWKLSLVSLATFPLILISTYLFKESVKKSYTEVRAQVARQNAFLQEQITGMGVVQVFAAEKKYKQQFSEINMAHQQANIRSVWAYSVFFPVMEIILAVAQGLLVWYGASLVLNHKSSIGILVSFIMYLNMLFRPLRMLADKFNTFQMGVVAANRVFALLEQDETIPNTGTFYSDNIQGNIEFKQVSFAYNAHKQVLKQLSFKVNAGTTLAIVGATGAGKSSIINILTRFYETQEGDIFIDNINIKDFEISCLRKQLGLVMQDVFLFSGTIFENITLRNPNITEQQVYDAAQLVGAHQFIVNLPNGYNYNVMERGATLSMGQRQLISFIRALVYNPKILILDEATSSIDTETEILIQNAIDKMIANRTCLIIAHRLSTIKKATQIMVLNKGKVVELDTHSNLLQIPNGYYNNLYHQQFEKELT